MQTRKSTLVALTLFLTLTLLFTALPLYVSASGNTASGSTTSGSTTSGNTTSGSTASGNAGNTVGGMLEDAADAVRGAAEDIFGSRRNTGNPVQDGNAAKDNSGPAANQRRDFLPPHYNTHTIPRF